MFAEISAPLNRLTSEKSVFVWSDEADQSFEKLKNLLCSYPVLAFPKIGEKFVVEVDASSSAVGGVLLQDGTDNKYHPVAYYSNTLNQSQRKWSTHSKETYVLILALRHWKVYLTGTNFVVRSDHNPLVTLQKTKDPRGKLTRWLTELEEFSFEIEYKPGKLNIIPDTLSRNIGADVTQPLDDLDDKIYEVFTDGENFKSQLCQEQIDDAVISDAIKNLTDCTKIEKVVD